MKEPNLEKTKEVKSNNTEKPPFLFHGSLVADIKEFEPRIGHTPDEKKIPRVYATQSAAWAAAHSWNWSSSEGIKLSAEGDHILLKVPRKFQKRLKVPIFIYKLPSTNFNQISKEGSGLTFDSKEKVRPISVERFNSVIEAIQHFGGQVALLD